MKYCIVLSDGMADEPIDLFGGITPMAAAHKPYMDQLAREGLVGMVRTVQDGFHPGSDVANLGVLGYDTKQCYTGRAPLEAAAHDIALADDELVFRCNLVTVDDGIITDYSAGGISEAEGEKVLEIIKQKLSSDKVRFESGVGYRHLMIVKGMPELLDSKTTPPHDIVDQPMLDYLPTKEGGKFLQDLMQRSHEILNGHEINQVRVDLGQNPANMIWLWGQGGACKPLPFKEKYGLDGAMISAVDLLNGIGKLIGFDTIKVSGATGYFDTNYAGKGEAALKALEEKDLVFVHIEAPDEEGHAGNALKKMRAIELIDKHIVQPLVKRSHQGGLRIMVLPDHPTPVRLKTHTSDSVPFLISGEGIPSYKSEGYTEEIGSKSGFIVDKGYELMDKFISGKI